VKCGGGENKSKVKSVILDFFFTHFCLEGDIEVVSDPTSEMFTLLIIVGSSIAFNPVPNFGRSPSIAFNPVPNFGRSPSHLHSYEPLLTLIESSLPPKPDIAPTSIFCNRELNMSTIKAIGFDMDYTLAEYKSPAFDELAYKGAVEKLIGMGYPEELRNFEYDSSKWCRGLIIDTQRGNFLKIDRHKYVRIAQHGFGVISSDYRKQIYSRTFNISPSFSEKHYVNVDTLFQLVDCSLFAATVTMKDEEEFAFLDGKTYEEMYRDVRASVDLCHRDGVIKDEVARNPAKYISKDDKMIPMLKQFKEDGKKVFLLTNSLWEYTLTVMNYLVGDDWTDLFDLIIVGSCKPVFLIDRFLNLFRIEEATGKLTNTDGVYEILEEKGGIGAETFLAKGKVFQGGNWLHLQAMLGINAGEEIIYVGDHLFSDVLRSKRTLGWRTVLIVPELEADLRVSGSDKVHDLEKQIIRIRLLRENISIEADKIRNNGGSDRLAELERMDQQLKDILIEIAGDQHRVFHEQWGMLFRTGYQSSRFAFYVSNYACLYTSRAGNLLSASKDRSFRTKSESLPHEEAF